MHCRVDITGPPTPRPGGLQGSVGGQREKGLHFQCRPGAWIHVLAIRHHHLPSLPAPLVQSWVATLPPEASVVGSTTGKENGTRLGRSLHVFPCSCLPGTVLEHSRSLLMASGLPARLLRALCSFAGSHSALQGDGRCGSPAVQPAPWAAGPHPWWGPGERSADPQSAGRERFWSRTRSALVLAVGEGEGSLEMSPPRGGTSE